MKVKSEVAKAALVESMVRVGDAVYNMGVDTFEEAFGPGPDDARDVWVAGCIGALLGMVEAIAERSRGPEAKEMLDLARAAGKKDFEDAAKRTEAAEKVLAEAGLDIKTPPEDVKAQPRPRVKVAGAPALRLLRTAQPDDQSATDGLRTMPDVTNCEFGTRTFHGVVTGLEQFLAHVAMSTCPPDVDRYAWQSLTLGAVQGTALAFAERHCSHNRYEMERISAEYTLQLREMFEEYDNNPEPTPPALKVVQKAKAADRKRKRKRAGKA